GMGVVDVFSKQRVVAFPELSLSAGAIYGWDKRNAFTYSLLTSLAAHYEFDIDAPFESLPTAIQQQILYVSGDENINFLYLDQKGKTTVKSHPFEGVIPNLERRWEETTSTAVKDELNKLRQSQTCPECQGARLGPDARNVRLCPAGATQATAGKAIDEVESLPLNTCLSWFKGLELQGIKQDIVERIIKEIITRLEFLNNVGLTYLSLDRRANTISGGEAQRIRLASQIGSGLTGVMYVPDEPSIGLHQRDNSKLIETLLALRDLGNSVIVVEHDEEMIRQADFIIDMGPE